MDALTDGEFNVNRPNADDAARATIEVGNRAGAMQTRGFLESLFSGKSDDLYCLSRSGERDRGVGSRAPEGGNEVMAMDA